MKTMKKHFAKRVLSMALAVVMMFTMLPLTIFAVTDTTTKVSDPSTMNDWKNFFGPDVKSTENAGGVWTDKSVFCDASAFTEQV